MSGRTANTCPLAYTLAEFILASAVVVLMLAALLPLMLFINTTYAKTRVLARLEQQATLCQERIKKDLFSTSRELIVLYPDDPSNVQAISFPVLQRPLDDTTLPVGTDGAIQWNRTVIYHMYANAGTGKLELRRTVFNPRVNGLTTAQRTAQIEDVFENGDGASALYGEGGASTQVLLDDVTAHRIVSTSVEVEGYAPERERASVKVGTWILGPGAHDFTFRVTGKNTQSSGYGFGLDQLMISAAGEGHDAEALLPPKKTADGSASHQSMVQYSGWTNNAQLGLIAAAAGASVTVTAYNDMWVESAFNSLLAVPTDAEVVYDTDAGEDVCRMIGGRVAWEAQRQCHGGLRGPFRGNTANGTVRCIVNSSDPYLGTEILYRGARGRVTLAASSDGALTILAGNIMRRQSGSTGEAASQRTLTFNAAAAGGGFVFNNGRSIIIPPGRALASDYFDLAIEKEQDYLVTLHFAGFGFFVNPAAWDDPRNVMQAYFLTNDTEDRSALADWSALADIVSPIDSLIALESLSISYPDNAAFTSQPVDTTLTTPTFRNLSWRPVTPEPAGTAVAIRLRAATQPDMSDAPAWDTLTAYTTSPQDLTSFTGKRYIQWQALLTSSSPYLATPRLRDVTVTWDGPERGIDVGVAFEKGPDRGKFDLAVDGQGPAPASLELSFQIAERLLDHVYERPFAISATPQNR
ncbi:MAG: hypothetical protein BWZ02_00913 [Lentisphaerae bacterium ADurb.BinA184]|nr:MAG: hypothetical protein BWZ02_00913 [Lentisphaerae bacterium ADurb.BinA184]